MKLFGYPFAPNTFKSFCTLLSFSIAFCCNFFTFGRDTLSCIENWENYWKLPRAGGGRCFFTHNCLPSDVAPKTWNTIHLYFQRGARKTINSWCQQIHREVIIDAHSRKIYLRNSTKPNRNRGLKNLWWQMDDKSEGRRNEYIEPTRSKTKGWLTEKFTTSGQIV